MAATVALGLAALGLFLHFGRGEPFAGYTTATVLGVPLVVTVAVLFGDLRRRTVGASADVFAGLLLIGALGIGVIVEFVAVRGDIDRMNSVFKLGLQAWVLYGVAGGYALWRLTTGIRWGRSWRRLGIRAAIGAVIGALVLASAVYPVLGTRGRLAGRFATQVPPTLDGMEVLRYVQMDDRGPMDLNEDYEAIRWLQRSGKVRGTPIIVEAVTDPYHWGGRVSTYTGLPTVLGWKWHQIQQRGQDWGPTLFREEQVRRLYATTNPEEAMDILRRYDVRWVYLGQLERNHYGTEGLAKFDALVTAGMLELAYEQGNTRIYRRTGI